MSMKSLSAVLFRTASIFRLPVGTPITESALEATPFKGCGPTEPENVGFVPVYGERFIREIDGNKLIAIRVENKILPAAAINEELEKQVLKRQLEEGRPLGRKERTRLKDEIIFSLLSRALTRSRVIHALITKNGLIIVGDNERFAQLLLNTLRLAMGSLPVARIGFKMHPEGILTSMIRTEGTPEFFLGDRAKLSDVDDQGVMSFAGIRLASDDVINHINNGATCHQLQLAWHGGVTFTFKNSMGLTGLIWDDRLIGGAINEEDLEAELNTAILLASNSFERLTTDVVALFGGEA